MSTQIAEAAEKAVRLRLGELNGPWVKAFKFTQSIVAPVVVAISGYVGNEIRLINGKLGELERNYAVLQQVVSQIKINSEVIARHEKILAENSTAIIALAKEIGTAEQRYMMFVTRREWELRNETRDREMNENRTSHEAIMVKLDRLIERMK